MIEPEQQDSTDQPLPDLDARRFSSDEEEGEVEDTSQADEIVPETPDDHPDSAEGGEVVTHPTKHDQLPDEQDVSDAELAALVDAGADSDQGQDA